MKAIHNMAVDGVNDLLVVSKSKDTSYLKAIHNALEQTVSIANREALTNPHTFKIIKNE